MINCICNRTHFHKLVGNTLNILLIVLYNYLEIAASENDFSVGHYFWSTFQEWLPKSKAIIDKYRNHKTTKDPNKDESNMCK